jgi:hypothetical protein
VTVVGSRTLSPCCQISGFGSTAALTASVMRSRLRDVGRNGLAAKVPYA